MLTQAKKTVSRSPQGKADEILPRLRRENVAQLFEKWGYGRVKDEAEQLRLALMLLECHDDAVLSHPDQVAVPRDPRRSSRSQTTS